MDMVRRPKLIIGTPTPYKGAFEPACIAAIDALKLHLRDRYDVESLEAYSSHYLHKQRNGLLDRPFDKFLWWDSDVVATPADFDRLEAHHLPIVSANIQYKSNRLKTIGGTFIPGYPGATTEADWFDYDRTGLLPADWAGFGFVLMDRCVLGATEEEVENNYPWVPGMVVDFPPGGKHRREMSGEDIAFFFGLFKRNVKFYIDMDCRPKHLNRNQIVQPKNQLFLYFSS